MYISLDAYRVFYYVAQYRSFTRAAELLCSNQPNVTRTIKNLERTLGCALFIRSSRSVQLTPEGEKLLGYVAPAIEQIQLGEDAILLQSSLKSGVITISASEIALHHTLLPILKRFRQKYPEIRLRIYNATTPEAISALKSYTVDLALITSPLHSTENLFVRELLTFRDAAICGSAYHALAESEVSLEALLSYPLISLRKGSVTYDLYRAFFQQHGLTLSPDIEAATSNQIIPMVRSNLGIGFVPEDTARQEAQKGGVYVIATQEAFPQRSVCMLKRKDMPLSMAARELEKMLIASGTC